MSGPIAALRAWLSERRQWRRGDDLVNFPLRAVKGIELRDALNAQAAADEAESRTEVAE